MIQHNEIIMKVTFKVHQSFDRNEGMVWKLIGHCKPDYAQTAKSRFIREMQTVEVPAGSTN